MFICLLHVYLFTICLFVYYLFTVCLFVYYLLICLLYVCLFVCLADGKWGAWGSWSQCSETCNDGQKYRLRECNNPPQRGTGLPCEGVNLDAAPCRVRDCGDPGENNIIPHQGEAKPATISVEVGMQI